MPSKLTVAKIVSTATPIAWSQAYHAGGFTAVLSITQKKDAELEETALHTVGKNLLDTLIAEYFTLVTKNLDTVRGSVEASVAKLPDNLYFSMVVGASVKNVLYIVVVNNGKAILKRGTKSGVLLELSNKDGQSQIESVSGYLDHGDLVILETQAFDEIIPQNEFVAEIDNQHPSDLAETFSPKVHEAQNGAASAIIFAYEEEEPSFLQKPYTPAVEERKVDRHKEFLLDDTKEEAEEEKKEEQTPKSEEKETEAKDEPKEEKYEKEESNFTSEQNFMPPQPLNTHVQLPNEGKRGISHSQKIFISIAIIIALVLGSSIFFFLSKQDTARKQQIFDSAYQPAKTKYEEGVGLIDLNKDLALSDLNSAKDMVTSAESKLLKNSTQYKQLQTLLSQITNSIQEASSANTVETTKASDSASPLLTFAAKHLDATYVTQDDKNFYIANASGITQYPKQNNTSKLLIKNSSAWKEVGGFSIYNNNIYVLDKTVGIIKYVNGATKQSYFASGSAPDLSKAVSLAIDRSIWILTSDGNIVKYTSGKADSFTVSGLDKPFSSPTNIVTSIDDTNIYILDKGNNRVVVLKKTGEFVSQYQTGIIKDATALDVDEKGKMAYILSSDTVYQIDLK